MSRRYNTHLLPPISSPDYYAWKASGDDWGTFIGSPRPQNQTTEDDGADCRECPAYEYCEFATVQESDQCRETLSREGDAE